MPLIIISGLPCSGKSTRAKELQQLFLKKNKKVTIISENITVPRAGYQKNEYFEDSQKEKIVRSDLKSEVFRLLNKEDVCVLDSGNYIKGYRYELYCASKSARTAQCTIYCAITKEQALEFNRNRLKTNDNLQQTEQQDELNSMNDNELYDNSSIAYSDNIFNALCLRFEEPHGNSRWDSPLFTIFPDDNIDFEAIYTALYKTKPPPPNQSTQNPPLSSTNYLYELDKLTQDIISKITSARKIGILGPVTIKDKLQVNVPSDLNVIQLNRLRRQFLNYNKMHTSGSIDIDTNNNNSLEKSIQLFVQFLNSNFNH